MLGGFGWLIGNAGYYPVGYRPFKPLGTWRSQNWWIYSSATALVVYVCVFVFLAGMIADIDYKKGLSMESSNRFDLAVPAYLDAIRWAPNQDFYFLFLGRAYNELAKRAPADAKAIRTIDKAIRSFQFWTDSGAAGWP